MKHLLVGPMLWTVYRPAVSGVEHVPVSGPAIIVGNHIGFLDSVFMPLVIDRRVYFLAKSDYFTGRGLKGRLVRWFFLGIGQLPIDRSGGKASEASLNSGLEILGRGEILGIYPEGTRSPDGRLYRGRTGVARMILETGVPVIPVAVTGTDRAMPIGAKLPKVAKIAVRFGEPLDFSRYAGLESDRFVLRAVTDEIMYELQQLSGQEYVDVYASSVKAKALAH